MHNNPSSSNQNKMGMKIREYITKNDVNEFRSNLNNYSGNLDSRLTIEPQGKNSLEVEEFNSFKSWIVI